MIELGELGDQNTEYCILVQQLRVLQESVSIYFPLFQYVDSKVMPIYQINFIYEIIDNRSPAFSSMFLLLMVLHLLGISLETYPATHLLIRQFIRDMLPFTNA